MSAEEPTRTFQAGSTRVTVVYKNARAREFEKRVTEVVTRTLADAAVLFGGPARDEHGAPARKLRLEARPKRAADTNR
jgi:hypothetical protein